MSDPNARRRQLAAAVNWRGLAEILGRSLEDIEGEDEAEQGERSGEGQGEKPKAETRASQLGL